MNSILGFTGTRKGLSDPQRETLLNVDYTSFDEVRLGDCVGADEQMYHIARSNGLKVIIHPPQNPKLRAYCHGDFIYPPRPYIQRDHDIVDAASILFATPSGYTEELRSGTWATIRYARSVGKPVVIVWPDGSVREEK